MDEYIKREDTFAALTEYYHHKSGVQHEALREALSRVPAADVQPVVHGKWKEESPDYLDGDSVYICSICGEIWNLEAGTPKESNMNYCHNCGAKMDL